MKKLDTIELEYRSCRECCDVSFCAALNIAKDLAKNNRDHMETVAGLERAYMESRLGDDNAFFALVKFANDMSVN